MTQTIMENHKSCTLVFAVIIQAFACQSYSQTRMLAISSHPCCCPLMMAARTDADAWLQDRLTRQKAGLVYY